MGSAQVRLMLRLAARRGGDKQGTVCLSVHRDCDVMEKSPVGESRDKAACKTCFGQASNLLMELEGGGGGGRAGGRWPAAGGWLNA